MLVDCFFESTINSPLREHSRAPFIEQVTQDLTLMLSTPLIPKAFFFNGVACWDSGKQSVRRSASYRAAKDFVFTQEQVSLYCCNVYSFRPPYLFFVA